MGNEIDIMLHPDTMEAARVFLNAVKDTDNFGYPVISNNDVTTTKDEKPDPYMGTEDYSKLERIEYKKNKLFNSKN
jgi:hypothetical protein